MRTTMVNVNQPGEMTDYDRQRRLQDALMMQILGQDKPGLQSGWSVGLNTLAAALMAKGMSKADAARAAQEQQGQQDLTNALMNIQAQPTEPAMLEAGLALQQYLGGPQDALTLTDVLMRQKFPKGQEYTLKEGETRFGADNTPLASNPKKVTPGEVWSEPYQQPGVGLVQRATDSGKIQPLKTGPLVENTIDAKGEEARVTERSKSQQKWFDEALQQATNASEQVTILEMAKNIDVQTGSAQGMVDTIAAFANWAGVDPKKLGFNADVANQEAFTGLMQQLVLAKMQAQKGPQTENDAKRIEKTVASIGNVQEAKDFLLRTALAIEKRKVEKAAFIDDWYIKNQTYEGARQAWDAHKKDVPIFGTNKNSKLPVFYDEFEEKALEANPGMTVEQIRQEWKKRYEFR